MHPKIDAPGEDGREGRLSRSDGVPPDKRGEFIVDNSEALPPGFNADLRSELTAPRR